MVWRVSSGLFVVATWGALVALNVRCAFLMDARVEFQIVAAIWLAVIDLAVIGFLVRAFDEGRAKRPGRAMACVALWAACSAAECAGGNMALLDYTHAATAPAALSEEQRQAAAAELRGEEANLGEIRRQMKSERKASLIAALERREKASVARIEIVRPQTFVAAQSSHPRLWWDGWEPYVVCSFWLLSQMTVFSLTGRLHGAPKMASGTASTAPTVPLSELPVPLPVSRDKNGTANGTDSGTESETDGEKADQSDYWLSGANPIEKTAKDSVSVPLPVSCPQRDSERDSQRDRPHLIVVNKDAPEAGFDSRVSDLQKAGFSLRQIAKRLNATKSAVEAADRRLKVKRKKRGATKGGD